MSSIDCCNVGVVIRERDTRAVGMILLYAHALGTEETEHFVTCYLTENFSVVANNCSKSSLQARRKLNTRARAMHGGHAGGLPTQRLLAQEFKLQNRFTLCM